jgi:hypothetical protein
MGFDLLRSYNDVFLPVADSLVSLLRGYRLDPRIAHLVS